MNGAERRMRIRSDGYGRDECRWGESDRGNVEESRSDVAVDEVADSFAKRRMTANKAIT